MDKYLVILVDSLHKKNTILDGIKNILDGQEQVLSREPFDIEEINTLMEQKADLIDKMNQVDDGFTALYARVSPKLKENPEEYADRIRELQKLIAEISDKTALIQAREMRLHSAIERLIVNIKPSSTRSVSKSDVAQKYYRTMKKATMPQSIFMNKKN